MIGNSTFENKSLLIQNCPVIWLVGLSGSGKTTLAKGLSQHLNEQGLANFILDGDELRKGINKGLGFSEADRKENLRRAAETAKLFQKAGIISVCSFISPTKEFREMIAEIIGKNYYEVFVNCSLETCEKRDVKGLYQKARNGEIAEFTGISAAFETPENPYLKIDTEKNNYETCLQQLISSLSSVGAEVK